MLSRVDNFFFNTPDVARLATYYSQILGIPIRREQVLKPGLMWMEINYGGMELSFRKAGGTPQEHPDLVGDFLELRPGEGATTSFQVTDTKRAREELLKRGVKFHGDTIPCTGGKELISIFEDPSHRPVQLYEVNLANPGEVAILSRSVGSRAEEIGANLRDVRGLALSAAFYSSNLDEVKKFYGGALELPLAWEGKNNIAFLLDGSVLEFRKAGAAAPLKPNQGAVVVFEVNNLKRSAEFLKKRGVAVRDFSSSSGNLAAGPRSSYVDPDGNPIEFWERH